MALTLTAKTPDEVFDYTWQPPFDEGDGLASYEASASGVTIDSAGVDGNDITLFISGGTAGSVGIITVSAESNEGRYYEETLYLPIQASTNAYAYTARDVANFALRKIVGNGESAEASELDDAIERLGDMLAEWKACGADTGVPLPLTAGATLYVSDAFLSAIKHNLRVACHDHYGQPIDATDALAARRGLQIIKASRLPTEREGADYY